MNDNVGCTNIGRFFRLITETTSLDIVTGASQQNILILSGTAAEPRRLTEALRWPRASVPCLPSLLASLVASLAPSVDSMTPTPRFHNFLSQGQHKPSNHRWQSPFCHLQYCESGRHRGLIRSYQCSQIPCIMNFLK